METTTNAQKRNKRTLNWGDFDLRFSRTFAICPIANDMQIEMRIQGRIGSGVDSRTRSALSEEVAADHDASIFLCFLELVSVHR